MSPNDAIQELKAAFEVRLTAVLKSLLETKHLYQTVTVELKDLLDKVQSRVSQEFRDRPHHFALQMLAENWVATDNAALRRPPLDVQRPAVTFNTPNVKLYCARCERVEAFNAVSSEDFLVRGTVGEPHKLGTSVVQVFVFSFLCQSCKAVPEVFLVRRHGLKLSLSGRSPMEHVAVPQNIPKPIHHFYTGAVVAYQSGQFLAANFMLRTLMEQWARAQSKTPDDQADTVLDEYMANLPSDFKSRFKSWREVYGELSADIHAALGSAELFERALGHIGEHFEARRLYKLAQGPA